MNIVADLHTHTLASQHAYSTLSELAEYAAKIGLRAIAIADHAPALPDSACLWHFGNMRVIPRRINGVYIIRAVEANILNENGELDMPEHYLKRLDYVIASFHEPVFQPADEKTHTKALEGVLKNPYVNTIGHPGNPNFKFDYEYIISKCNEYGKTVELNGHSSRARRGSEECCFEIAKICKKHNVPVFINSDAHICFDVGNVGLALELAGKAGISQDMIINADFKALRQYFIDKKGLDISEDIQ